MEGGSRRDDDRGPRRRGRGVALATLALVITIVSYLAFTTTDARTYQLLFTDAGQLVKGDEVEVGGVPVGTVTDISLTSNNLADVTVRVNPPIAPLHEGTTAQIRSPSLSGVASRYVALAPGPNTAPELADGAALPPTATSDIVDLDQIFNTFNAMARKGLQEIIQGSATQYAGASRQINESIPYFSPALSATSHLLAELDADQAAFTNFLVATSNTVTALAARAPQLSALVQNADQTFAAIGAQSRALTAGLRELPAALQQGDATLAELNPALDALTQLVDASKPDTRTLGPLLRALAPVLGAAQGPVTNLSLAISRPGANNDLTDAARALPSLEQAFATTAPDTETALRAAVPITTFLRPYTPDLIGSLRAVGQSTSYYDADGHYAHVSPAFADFASGGDNTLTPVNPARGLSALQTGQTKRCPGAAAAPPADASAPFTANGTLDCNPSEVPSS